MVCDRLGGIEADWATTRTHDADAAGHAALRNLAALQAELRRSLLDPRRTFRLNASDPLGGGIDFTRLDAMADTRWDATQPPNGAVLAESVAIAA